MIIYVRFDKENLRTDVMRAYQIYMIMKMMTVSF